MTEEIQEDIVDDKQKFGEMQADYQCFRVEFGAELKAARELLNDIKTELKKSRNEATQIKRTWKAVSEILDVEPEALKGLALDAGHMMAKIIHLESEALAFRNNAARMDKVERSILTVDTFANKMMKNIDELRDNAVAVKKSVEKAQATADKAFGNDDITYQALMELASKIDFLMKEHKKAAKAKLKEKKPIETISKDPDNSWML